jgi:hypothetical protein
MSFGETRPWFAGWAVLLQLTRKRAFVDVAAQQMDRFDSLCDSNDTRRSSAREEDRSRSIPGSQGLNEQGSDRTSHWLPLHTCHYRIVMCYNLWYLLNTTCTILTSITTLSPNITQLMDKIQRNTNLSRNFPLTYNNSNTSCKEKADHGQFVPSPNSVIYIDHGSPKYWHLVL